MKTYGMLTFILILSIFFGIVCYGDEAQETTDNIKVEDGSEAELIDGVDSQKDGNTIQDWREETRQIGSYKVTTPRQYIVDNSISSDFYICFIAPNGSEMNIFVLDGAIEKVIDSDVEGNTLVRLEEVSRDGRKAQYIEIKGSQDGIDYSAYELLWQGNSNHVLKYVIFSKNEGEDHTEELLSALALTQSVESEAETDSLNNDKDIEMTKTDNAVSVNDAKVLISSKIRSRVSMNYDDTDVDEIKINENVGTDKSGDYIVLVYLTWNRKNFAETTEKMLTMYSNDLAATVAENCPEVEEIAVFWNVPYLGVTSKWAYEKKGDGMYLENTAIGW